MKTIQNTFIATILLSVVSGLVCPLTITEASIHPSLQTTNMKTVLSSNKADLKIVSSNIDYSTPLAQSDGQFHDGLLFAQTTDGKLLFYNTAGKQSFILPQNLVPMSDFYQQRALVKDINSKLYGYINTKGKLVIDCSYIQASYFSEDIAYVQKSKSDNGSFINTTGKKILDLERSYDSNFNFTEGLALSYSKNSDKIGYLNKAGNIVIPYKYNYGRNFSEKLAVVQDGNQNYGYINRTGKVIIPFQYKAAGDFSQGLAPVQNKKGKWGFINLKGKVVIPFQFNQADSFSEGLAAVYNDKGNVGFIDSTGKWIIAYQKYNKATSFHNGVALIGVTTSHSSKLGYIDQRGKLLTALAYRSGSAFNEGYGVLINSLNQATIYQKYFFENNLYE